MLQTQGGIVKPDFRCACLPHIWESSSLTDSFVRPIDDYETTTLPIFTDRGENKPYIADPLSIYAGHLEYEADREDLAWIGAAPSSLFVASFSLLMVAVFSLESFNRKRTQSVPPLSDSELEELFTKWEFFTLIDPVRSLPHATDVIMLSPCVWLIERAHLNGISCKMRRDPQTTHIGTVRLSVLVRFQPELLKSSPLIVFSLGYPNITVEAVIYSPVFSIQKSLNNILSASASAKRRSGMSASEPVVPSNLKRPLQ